MDLGFDCVHRVLSSCGKKRWGLTLIFVLATFISTVAVAGGPESREVTYLNPGIETGLTWHNVDGEFGTTLGLRMSLNDAVRYMVPVEWEGIYGHVQRDFRTDSWRSGLGYGFGFLFLGLEAGVAVHVDDRDTNLGAEAAVLGTIGIAGVHLRHTQCYERPAITEIGLRAALPILW